MRVPTQRPEASRPQTRLFWNQALELHQWLLGTQQAMLSPAADPDSNPAWVTPVRGSCKTAWATPWKNGERAVKITEL